MVELWVIASQTKAAPSGSHTCKKKVSDGRGGGITQSICLWFYRVTNAVLDEGVKVLIFDSWCNGTKKIHTISNLAKKIEFQASLAPFNFPAQPIVNGPKAQFMKVQK